MGVVYEALDSELDRAVALKRVHPRRTDADTRARLLSEARTLARLSHPNIVPVFDVTTEGDEVFVAMELVLGDDLRHWGRRQPRSWRAIVEVLAQAGDGLAYAHAQGVVHRDFKPTNVLIGHDGRARVVDFGLARPIPEETPASSVEGSDASEDPSPGSGTPRYMAPEVRAGQAASPLADQFGFCVTGWELLFGHRPTSIDDARAHAQGRRVPRRIRAALLRGLSEAPTDRFPDMASLLTSLRRSSSAPLWIAGAGLLAVVGAAAWPGDDPCLDVGSAIDSTWGPTRLAALQEAFASTGSVNAQQAAERVGARLDRHVAGWIAERERSCHATLVQRTQPRGMYELQTACLEDVRIATDALLEILISDPDPELVHRAVSAVAALPEPSDCAEPDGSSTGPLDGDDEARSLRADLSRVQALVRAGRASAALDAAAALVDAATTADDAWTAARAGLLRAQVELSTGDEAAAEQSLSAATIAAARANHDPTVAEAWAMMAYLIAGDPERRNELGTLLTVAEAALARAGDDPRLAIRLQRARARMLSAQGDLEAAAELSVEIAEASERQLGVDDPELPDALTDAGLALHDSGRPDAARVHLERAVELDVELFGDRHPRLAADWHNLALVAPTADEAEALLRKSLTLHEEVFGRTSTVVADDLANLGIFLHDGGKYEEAEQVLLESLEIQRERHGGDHKNTAHVLQYLAELLNDTGQRERAQAYAEESLAMRQRILPEGHIDIARGHQLIGAIALNEGRYDDARVSYQQSLELRRRSLRPDDPKLAGPYYGLAQVELQAHNPEAAVKACRTSLALEEGAYGPDHPRVGVHLVCLAQSLRQAGRPEEALVPARRATALWREDTVDPIRVAMARIELAKSLRAAGGQPDEVLGLATEAREILSKHPGAADGLIAELDVLIDAAPTASAPAAR